MTRELTRDATADDLEAIGTVALAAGQDGEWSGSDPAYVNHLLAHGHVVIAERDGAVAGFGATRRIGSGPGAATMLCDLFVHPRAHGLGFGRSMLAALWRPGTPRMTFSSTHPHALPLYTRAGLDAWWPLLYLAGNATTLRPAADWAVRSAGADEVAALEERWTGIDRAVDHHAWAARPAGQPLTACFEGEPLAAGTSGGADGEYGLTHFALAPGIGDGQAAAAVLAALAGLDAPGGRARVCLPAPHPAVRPLLSAGWRCEYIDFFMATDPALLDPRRAVPSPALA